MSVQQISVFLENRSGTFADLTRILSENKINLRAFLGGKAGHAHIIIKVRDNDKAESALRSAGFELLEQD